MTDERSELDGLRSLDPQAITAIHDRYFAQVYRYARYRLGDSPAAEDIASEVFVRLLEAAAAGRSPSTSLHGWLFGTASNLVNSHFRRHYARPREPLREDLPGNGADPLRLAEDGEQRALLRQAIGHLTPEQQEVLALRFGGGLSLEQTAAVLRKKPNAIKALQFRALEAMRRRMQREAP